MPEEDKGQRETCAVAGSIAAVVDSEIVVVAAEED